MMKAPSAADAQVKVRLDPATRDRLKSIAALNRRTLMREIEFRVIESLEREENQRAGRDDMQGAAQ